MEKIIPILEKDIKKLFSKESSGHDLYHLKRTLNLALRIQKSEGGDKEVIAASAFLHDIHRIIGKETGKYCAPKDSLPKIKEILDRTDLPNPKKKRILHCIEFHEEYDFSPSGKTSRDIETQILQDADNLDAIGALGIARVFSFCGANNIDMWLPEKPFNQGKFDESVYDISAIHHFYSKLLRLKDNMNTKTAKAMAAKRHEFMELFLKRFFDEWKGIV